MSRRSHKNFRKCGGLRIIGQGELSEFDAALYPAGVGLIAPKYSTVSTLPSTVVNGMRYVYNGKEYLGVDGIWSQQSFITTAFYINRICGNVDNAGVATAKDQIRTISAAFNANFDFRIDITFSQSLSDTLDYTGLFCQCTIDVLTNRGLWVERNALTTGYRISVYDSAGNPRSVLINDVITGYARCLTLVRSGNTITVSLDNATVGTIDCTGFIINSGSAINIGSRLSGSRCIKGTMYSVRLQQSTASFQYDFSTGIGTTIYDRSGNKNNATLTDSTPANFWKNTWAANC